MINDIYTALEDAGINVSDHYESDLFVPVTEVSQGIIDRYRWKSNVEKILQETGEYYFCIPFAYQPFWAEKAM